MTQKDLMKIAADEDLMEALQEMASIQRNMCHKTIYEQKTATRKMKDLAREIIEGVKGN